MHWLWHALGIDTQQSWAYDFWSGIGTQFKLTGLLLPYVLYRKHNCHVHKCWRIGRFQADRWVVCARHHPDDTPTHADLLGTMGGKS